MCDEGVARWNTSRQGFNAIRCRGIRDIQSGGLRMMTRAAGISRSLGIWVCKQRRQDETAACGIVHSKRREKDQRERTVEKKKEKQRARMDRTEYLMGRDEGKGKPSQLLGVLQWGNFCKHWFAHSKQPSTCPTSTNLTVQKQSRLMSRGEKRGGVKHWPRPSPRSSPCRA